MRDQTGGLADDMSELVQRILADVAGDTPVDVHPSALVEIESYTRHVGVTDLDPPQLRIVVRGILEDAFSQAVAGEAVNAGTVREVLRRRCNSPWHPCYEVALGILDQRGIDVAEMRDARQRSLEDLNRRISSIERDLPADDVDV